MTTKDLLFARRYRGAHVAPTWWRRWRLRIGLMTVALSYMIGPVIWQWEALGPQRSSLAAQRAATPPPPESTEMLLASTPGDLAPTLELLTSISSRLAGPEVVILVGQILLVALAATTAVLGSRIELRRVTSRGRHHVPAR